MYTIHNFKIESSQGLIAPTRWTVQESFILPSLEINKYIRSLYHFPKTQHQINCTWTLIVQKTRWFRGRSCYSLLIFIIESAPIMEEEKEIMEKLKKNKQQLNIRETYSDLITNQNGETTWKTEELSPFSALICCPQLNFRAFTMPMINHFSLPASVTLLTPQVAISLHE